MTHLIIKNFLYAFVALFPMVNPIAMSAIFLSMTKDFTQSDRTKLSKLVAIYGTALSTGVLLIGPFLLKFFGIEVADIRVAGGLVIAFIAWRMLMGTPHNKRKEEHKDEVDQNTDPMSLAFFPLTMPLTAGAGAIAMTITLATQAEQSVGFQSMLSQYLGIFIAIIVVFFIVYICYRFSSTIFRLLGKSGGMVVSQLSAFILLAIGVSMLWSGLKMLIHS